MKEIDERIVRARIRLVIQQPFFGVLALQLMIVEDESVGTMAVDGRHLYYAPAFLDTLTDHELEGVIVHEILHCAYRHHTRRKNRDPKWWNNACDYVVNLVVLAAGFKLPKDRLEDASYAGMGAEEVYSRLSQKAKPTPQGQQGQGPSGGASQPGGAGPASQGGLQPGNTPGTAQNGAASPSKAGSEGSPGQGQPTGSPGQGKQGQPASDGPGAGQGASFGDCPWGGVMDAAPAHDQAGLAAMENEWAVKVRGALAVGGKNAGRYGGALEHLAKAIDKPVIDWRSELRRFIDDKVNVDYSWTSPNKRMMGHGFILPGTIKDSIQKMVVGIDTSGSVSDTLLNKFAAELQDILDNGGVQELVIVYTDAKVQSVERYSRYDTVKLTAKGRGGTRFSPTFAWVDENEPDTSALIYFTDMECNDFGLEPTYPVMWMAYGNESGIANKKVPFGEIIFVEDEQ